MPDKYIVTGLFSTKSLVVTGTTTRLSISPLLLYCFPLSLKTNPLNLILITFILI
jgi:hypothetical protein